MPIKLNFIHFIASHLDSISLSLPLFIPFRSVCVRFPFCSHIFYSNVEIHCQYAHCAHTQSVANQKKNIWNGMRVAHIDKIKEVECSASANCTRSLKFFFSIRNSIWRLENCLCFLWNTKMDVWNGERAVSWNSIKVKPSQAKPNYLISFYMHFHMNCKCAAAIVVCCNG